MKGDTVDVVVGVDVDVDDVATNVDNARFTVDIVFVFV